MCKREGGRRDGGKDSNDIMACIVKCGICSIFSEYNNYVDLGGRGEVVHQ